MKIALTKIALLASCFFASSHNADATFTLVPDCIDGFHTEGHLYKFQGKYKTAAPASMVEEKDILSSSRNPEAIKAMNAKWNSLDKIRYVFIHGFETNYMISSLARQISPDDAHVGNDQNWFKKT